MSNRDTPMFRGMAMIVNLDTNEMQKRACELALKYPEDCVYSPVSPAGRVSTKFYFYYMNKDLGGKDFNEEWLKTGIGPQILSE